jgi:6-phosphogluconolactonase
MHVVTIYLGTYTGDGGEGISAVGFDAARRVLTAPRLVGAMPDPAFLALSPDGRRLYAVCETGTDVWAWAITPGQATLDLIGRQDTGLAGPCHLVVDRSGRCLIVAHYTAGAVSVLPLGEDGRPGAPSSVVRHRGTSVHPTRQRQPHVHSVTLSPDNRHVIVCDLGTDRVHSYALDAAAGTLQAAGEPGVSMAAGAGPRHAAFAPDGRQIFVINELGNTVVACAFEAGSGTLRVGAGVGTLPGGFAGESTTAEVRVHPNGRWVYGSNRGHDSLVWLEFDAATGAWAARGHVPSGGRTPRNFALSPDGGWLVVANQESDNLRLCQIEATTGRPVVVGDFPGPCRPVCVVWAGAVTA